MTGPLEIAGYLIVLLALAQVAVAIAGAMQRRTSEARHERDAAMLFEDRARLLLGTARAERDREELTWQGLRKFTIDRKVPEAGGITSFYLVPHDGQALPPFEPGQYLTFQLRIPDQPKPVIRCYSLSDGTNELSYYRVSIKRQGPPPKEPDAPPGLSSCFFHDVLEEGDLLDVRAPGGHFYLDQTNEAPVVLIGGGVGLTPVLSMLNTICASGSKREVWFFYGMRHRGEHAMYEHLDTIRRNFENVRMNICYSNPTEDCVEGRDYDHEGRVSVELFKKVLPSNNYDFYICGPPPMMDSVTRDLAEWGVPDDRVNFEAFGPATVKRKKPAAEAEAAEAAAADGGIEVVFARSGKTINWSAALGSLLELAEDNDVALDSGCRAGNCGTCVTAIKEGDVSYLSDPGAPPDAGTCLACIAVPKERIVLDA